MNIVTKEFKNNKEAQRYFNYKKCDNIYYGLKAGTVKTIGFASLTIKNNKITIKSEIENETKLNQLLEN